MLPLQMLAVIRDPLGILAPNRLICIVPGKPCLCYINRKLSWMGRRRRGWSCPGDGDGCSC